MACFYFSNNCMLVCYIKSFSLTREKIHWTKAQSNSITFQSHSAIKMFSFRLLSLVFHIQISISQSIDSKLSSDLLPSRVGLDTLILENQEGKGNNPFFLFRDLTFCCIGILCPKLSYMHAFLLVPSLCQVLVTGFTGMNRGSRMSY